MSKSNTPKVLMIAWSDLRFYPPVFNLAQTLQRQGVATKTLGFKVSSPKGSKPCDSSDSTVHKVNAAPVGLLGKANCFIRMVAWLAVQCVSWRPTCVVAHGSQAVSLAVCASWLSGAKLIYCAHEMSDDAPDSPWLRIANYFEARASRRFFAVACAAPERAEILARRFKLRTEPLVVENSPLADDGFCACSVDTAVEFARRKVPAAEYVVVYAGRFGKGMGFAELCSAIRSLPDNYVLVAAGAVDADFRAKFQDLFRAPRVLYYGTVPYPHLRRWLRGGSAGVAFYEPKSANTLHAAPCKMYEYLAAGLPVICNSFPTSRATVGRHGLGRCLDEFAPQVIASAIRDTCEAGDRLALSDACRRFFEEELSYECRADGLVAACIGAR